MTPQRHWHQLTDFEKGEICALRRSMSHQKIGDELDIPRHTVSNFLKRLDNHDSINNLPHPGGPRKTTTADDRYIVHLAKTHTHIPLKELHFETNLNVSEQTIHRRLRENGIRKWRAVGRA